MAELLHHRIFEVGCIQGKEVHVPLLKYLKRHPIPRFPVNAFLDRGLAAEADCRAHFVAAFEIVTRFIIRLHKAYGVVRCNLFVN